MGLSYPVAGMSAGGEGPLSGVRVLDMTRLAPGPYGSMLLADLGAEVLVVGGGRTGLPVPSLSRGKRFINLDLKSSEGREVLHRLVAEMDVFIEGFRPGVADRLGAGYDELRALNNRLIYCSVTGYGQSGPLAHRAGHDINYLAAAGALGTFGPADGPPVPPLNLAADFAGGGLLAAFGIVSALHERQRSGTGQHVDVAMVDGVMSMMGMNYRDWGSAALPGRGEGLLTGSVPFYRCFECSDGRYVAVGALEDAFFANLWSTLDLGEVPDHLDRANWEEIGARLESSFRLRPMQEWAELFSGVDACVSPVLTPDELADDDQVRQRHPGFEPHRVPTVPVFSRTRAVVSETDMRDATDDLLADLGLPPEAVTKARGTGETQVKGLSWPPI